MQTICNSQSICNWKYKLFASYELFACKQFVTAFVFCSCFVLFFYCVVVVLANCKLFTYNVNNLLPFWKQVFVNCSFFIIQTMFFCSFLFCLIAFLLCKLFAYCIMQIQTICCRFASKYNYLPTATFMQTSCCCCLLLLLLLLFVCIFVVVVVAAAAVAVVIAVVLLSFLPTVNCLHINCLHINCLHINCLHIMWTICCRCLFFVFVWFFCFVLSFGQSTNFRMDCVNNLQYAK